jgi:thiol-disulfide isomerase/thioredoxin
VNKPTREGFRQKGAAAAALFLLAAGSFSETSRLAGELDAKGLTERIARERGNVVLVNFWATWCVPCREEFPQLARLQKKLGGEGLRVLGISTDLARDVPEVEKFLEQQNPGFPNYRKKSGGDDGDFINAVDPSWGGELPFTVLYGRDGKKAKVFSGAHAYREYEREIRRHLTRIIHGHPAETRVFR